jgi:predicted component of type VI protein secretion system
LQDASTREQDLLQKIKALEVQYSTQEAVAASSSQRQSALERQIVQLDSTVIQQQAEILSLKQQLTAALGWFNAVLSVLSFDGACVHVCAWKIRL